MFCLNRSFLGIDSFGKLLKSLDSPFSTHSDLLMVEWQVALYVLVMSVPKSAKDSTSQNTPWPSAIDCLQSNTQCTTTLI